jgi:hypothetical protein
MVDTNDLFADLDLDAAAARRESAFPEGIPVKFGGNTFILPAELPAEALDPLLDLDIDMASIIASAARIQATATEEQQRQAGTQVMIDALLANPNLPVDAIRALRSALAVLFGEEQWIKFNESRPSVPDIVRLVRGLWRAYGTSLGEAFGWGGPSESDGETSKQTSNGSTGSTRARSGGSRARKGSSASAT